MNSPTARPIALSLIRKLYWESPENSFEDQLNLEFESQRDGGRGGRFQGGRHRVPREAPGEVQRQMIEAGARRAASRRWYPGATGVTGAAKLSGGASQETWSFDIVHRRRHDRRDPAPLAAGLWRGAHARGRARCRGAR